MQEINRFTDSTPVDDTAFRLTDGDWEDFDVRSFAPEENTEPEKNNRDYEKEIIDV